MARKNAKQNEKKMNTYTHTQKQKQNKNTY